MNKEILLSNSLGNKKEIFEPLDKKNIGMYVCGPTVYDDPHIGNARPIVIFDLLFKVLKCKYGKEFVTYVRNITDIDDKIINSSKEKNISISELTEKITKTFHDDCNYLNCETPTHEPKATENIKLMIEMIEDLISKEYAYESEKHVYFKVKNFKDYGKLSNKKLEDLIAGSRVDISEKKHNPEDFVLWKPSKENEPYWSSPWGNGRPGWHLECSVMSKKYLGETFDIHGGGRDLIFPHHENEIAQSVCANNKKFANYWVHNGFITVSKEKMSKSQGNILKIDSLKNKYNGQVLRLALMSSHYRQPLDWTNRKVTEAQNIINKWLNVTNNKDLNINGIPTNKILEALCDDLNIPLAITEMHNLLKEEDYDGFANSLFFLGFHSNNVIKSKNNLDKQTINEMINLLIVERQNARKNKDYRKSDLIRIKLEKAGVTINDHGNETTWSLKPNFNPSSLLTEN